MGAVPVTFSGVFFPKNKKDKPVAAVFVGQAWIPGLSVGGGPAGPEPHPEHPIVIPPEQIPPPIDAHPEHPIVIPDPPEIPPNPSEPKPPPPEGGWGWHPEYGWGYFPGTGGPAPH